MRRLKLLTGTVCTRIITGTQYLRVNTRTHYLCVFKYSANKQNLKSKQPQVQL